MKNLHKILIFLAILSIVACNPFISKELRHKKKCNRKTERLIRKCPELLKPDTIIDTVIVEVAAINIDVSLPVNKDVSEIDSIIASYKDQIDSILAHKLGTEIKEYVRERPCIIDTLNFEENGISVKVFQSDGKIHISIKKPKEKIKVIVKVEAPKIVKIKLTGWEKFMQFLGRFWWWIIIIGIIGTTLGIFKNNIKNYLKL